MQLVCGGHDADVSKSQLGPRPNSTSMNNTLIEDLLFDNFSGTINECVLPRIRHDTSSNSILPSVNLDSSKAPVSPTLAGICSAIFHGCASVLNMLWGPGTTLKVRLERRSSSLTSTPTPVRSRRFLALVRVYP